jgi:acetyltransferase-like isoleucine patch superfamily enzyme
MFTKIRIRLKRTYQKIYHGFSSIGFDCQFNRQIKIKGGDKIRLGHQVHLERYVLMDAINWGDGNITIGDRTQIHDFSQLRCYGGDIKIGSDCSVNSFCILYGHGKLTIGNNVRIAAHVVIIPANHKFEDPETLIMNQGETRKGIKIEDDVWIGAGSIILDGVTIGKGSVVGAGSVVSKNVPSYCVVAGVPAKKIRDRHEQ